MWDHIKLADIYCRLSDEEKKHGNESESITNQRAIIRDYCEKHDIIIVKEFVDDGYSGGNFERPGFQAMLNHLSGGKVNMVITKDLSRLGRDMTESSYYAERFFPEHGIHYLAPGNDFDSMGDNLMAPFQFAMNDVYLRDTSRKVRQTLDMKRRKGKYAACPPYGYRKDPRCRHHLIPDAETAPVVEEIYDLYLSGLSCKMIGERLTAQGIPTPSEMKRARGEDLGRRSSAAWSKGTIRKILQNPVYLGHMVQGKEEKISFKEKKTRELPRNQWIVVEHTHEAIIKEEIFGDVKKRMAERRLARTRIAKEENT